MNDFTKEELQELQGSRCYHLDDSYPSNDKLFIKLESMIESYCEHDPDGVRYQTITTQGASSPSFRRVKCRAYYE